MINQLAVGRTPNSKVAGKSLSPTQINSTLIPSSNLGVKSSLLPIEDSGEDVFSFDDKLGLFKETKSRQETLQKSSNWKTSATFSKTMIESRSDNEHSSNECEDDKEDHSYVDIIPDEKATEKPLSSDEATTLLAQVVADLTEPQKRNCFKKSNSTGGIRMKPLEMNEGRRASAPVVGSKEYLTSSVSEIDAQGSLSNTQWKLKLEKINEVSFVETTESGENPSPPKGPASINNTNSLRNDRPRSLSELIAVELEMPTQVKRNMPRSKTHLGVTKSSVGSSLADLSSARHRGLRAAFSLSPSSSDFSHQLEKDSTHFSFIACSDNVPSFPKTRVIKAAESGLDGSRHILNSSPLPPEFHTTNSDDSFDADADQLSPVSPTTNEAIPPRPPKDTDVKTRKGRSASRSPPPPLPERLPSLPVNATKETLQPTKYDGFTKPYANTRPKVQPRVPNIQPIQNTGPDNSSDSISPPPRPPKPESLSNSVRKAVVDQNKQSSAGFSPKASARRFTTEKRTDGYPWELEREKDNTPKVGKMKQPVVTVTPPRSPKFNKRSRVNINNDLFSYCLYS